MQIIIIVVFNFGRGCLKKMAVPSCVTFRDQHVLMDVGKSRYGNWTRLETFCHILAAKKALRVSMDGFEDILTDGLKIAKELYRRGVIHRSSVDNCDPAQFADIPDFTMNKNSFFSPMFRAIDNSFKCWFVLLEVLRMYPECREATDRMEIVYRQALDEIEIDKYRGEIQPASPEEAKMLFESICGELDSLWDSAKVLMDVVEVEKLRNNVRLCYLDNKEENFNQKSREEIYATLRSRIDVMNLNQIETMLMGGDYSSLQDKLRAFLQYRALTSARIRIKDFAYQLENNPIHKPIKFEEGPAMEFLVSWDHDETMFRYFWLMEVVFVSLSRHQYFHHVNVADFGFCYYLPDWMRYAMVKLTRDHAYSLIQEGVRRASVLSEITVLDPSWNLTEQDEYDFMTSIININRGRIVDVDETLQGLKPFRKWEALDIDKRMDHFIDYLEEWPAAIAVPPQIITISNFMSFYETNHIWISPPFYTKRKGFKFCIIVYPRGTRNGLDTHLSVGACLMRGENDARLAYPAKGELTVRLVNQTGDHNHIQHTIQYNSTTRPEACERVKNCNDFAKVGLSVNQFAPLEILDYNEKQGTQYLVNNTIWLQVVHAKFVHRD